MQQALERKAQLVSYFDALTVSCASDLFNLTPVQARNFTIFKARASVVVVGNGPVCSKHRKTIENDFDVVVRFNDFTKSTSKVGSKLDLHVMNMCTSDNFLKLHQSGVPTLIMEQNHVDRNES